MIHPSYKEMIDAVNATSEDDTVPVVSSRYSIVMATAHRARQLVDGDPALIDDIEDRKSLSIAVDELFQGEVKIIPEKAEQD
ncbi:MAG: DNA-directed RNA polymerase subunit omega [Lachnospiraceae bacterium]|nr:DNA-directed RNA polymerase subunit omega [Lachnospiraceae bacterium]